jgi:hypothetical protein
MRRKTLFTLFVTAFAIFSMVGYAMAANTVTITSDKPIEPKSECSVAGSISWNMDNQTAMNVGDVVRFLLPQNVTTCGATNFFLQLDPDLNGILPGIPTDPVQSTALGAGAPGGTQHFEYRLNGVLVAPAGIIPDVVSGDVWSPGFLVQANDSSQTFQMTLAVRVAVAGGGAGSLPVGTILTNPALDLEVKYTPADISGNLVVKYFSGNIGPVAPAPIRWFWTPLNPTTLPLIYDTRLTAESENTLCVDNLEFTGSTVAAIPESRATLPQYQLNFLGDFIIQQAISAVTYAIGPACKDEICNEVPLLATINQQGEEVDASGSFDFGDYIAAAPGAVTERWVSAGYCVTAATLGNGIKLNLDGQDFAVGDEYTITVTVRVGSSADPDRAIFRTGTDISLAFTDNNASGNCEGSGLPIVFDGGSGWAAAGGAGPVFNRTALSYTFTIAAAQMDADAIILDLPWVDMDLEEVSAGEKVYFDVTWEKQPCGGNIAEATICAAELIDLCQVPGQIDGIAFIGDRSLTNVLHGYLGRIYDNAAWPNATDDDLFFPYAPSLNDPLFFTGICITNVGQAAQVLTIMVRDAEGGMATYTSDTLAAGNMWVNTLDAIADDLVDGATPLNRDLPVNVTVTGLSPAAE